MSLLRKNIATLLAWQMATNLLPLITFSYLTRTLNPEGFGLLSFTQGIIAYAVLLADWGFGISASQQVARQQHDAAAISRIFWDTMLAKVLLVLVSLLLLLLVLVLIPRLRAQMDLLLVMWLLAPAAVFMPAWLLQGLEKMGGFATSSVLGSICTIPLIFWLVQGPGDVLLAGLIQVLASTISAVVGLVGYIDWASFAGAARPCWALSNRYDRGDMYSWPRQRSIFTRRVTQSFWERLPTCVRLACLLALTSCERQPKDC